MVMIDRVIFDKLINEFFVIHDGSSQICELLHAESGVTSGE